MSVSRVLCWLSVVAILGLWTGDTVTISTQAQESVLLRVLTYEHKLTPEMITSFEATNPDIQIEHIPYDNFALDLAVATGDMPDVLCVETDQVAQLVNDSLLLNLTNLFNASDLIYVNDLSNSANYYEFNNQYYRLPKDWSLDFNL